MLWYIKNQYFPILNDRYWYHRQSSVFEFLIEIWHEFKQLLDRITVILKIILLLLKKCLMPFYSMYKETFKKEIGWTVDYDCTLSIWYHNGFFFFRFVCIILLLKNTRHGSKSITNVKYPLEAIMFIIFTLLWHTGRKMQ